jgi:dUTP pyrophosphatase
LKVQFKRLPHGEGLPLPAYATDGAAAMDICSAVQDFVLPAGTHVMVNTGFAVAVPAGYEMQVRPRSGFAAKHAVTVTNSPGTVDSDYRGELCVLLINHGAEDLKVERGDRIAQLVVAPVTRVEAVEVEELDSTGRGAGGFGSTGRKFFGQQEGA